MTGWEDLPLELRDEIWTYVKVAICESLLIMEEVTLLQCVETLKGKSEKELYPLSALAETQKRADETKLKSACMVSKQLALDFRDVLHARLAKLEELTSHFAKEQEELRYRQRGWWSVTSKQKKDLDVVDKCLWNWRRSTTRRMEALEKLVARVDNWQTCGVCWRQLPLDLVYHILGYAVQLCVPKEEAWERFEEDKNSYYAADVMHEKYCGTLRRRLFSLSVVCKKASSYVTPGLGFLEEELQDLEERYERRRESREYYQPDDESDYHYQDNERALSNAKDWYDACQVLHKLARRMQCIASSWSIRKSGEYPGPLRRRLETEAFRLPAFEDLKQDVRNSWYWSSELQEGLIKANFRSRRRDFAMLRLVSLAVPSAWLVLRLQRYLKALKDFDTEVSQQIVQATKDLDGKASGKLHKASRKLDGKRFWLGQLREWQNDANDLLAKVQAWRQGRKVNKLAARSVGRTLEQEREQVLQTDDYDADDDAEFEVDEAELDERE